MAQSVIQLLDRFTLATKYGEPDVYSAWFKIPDSVRHADLWVQCMATRINNAEFWLETSIDKVSIVSTTTTVISKAETHESTVSVGLGPYVRVGFKPEKVGYDVDMIISAHLVCKTAN